MNMPLVLLNRRRRGVSGSPAFSPSAIFALAEPGVWYDPSDLTTMFQDRAGTTAVTTPGQFVGVRLDKSKGLALGAELVTNGDFATDTVWVKGVGWSISGGVASITSSAASNAITQPVGTAGRVYQITYTVVSVSAQGFRAFAGGTNGAVRSVAGTYTETLVCGTTNTSIGIGAWATGTTGSIDNVSVKEITGNHSVAPTDAARMTYGIEPKTGTRNLLTFTEQYDNAIWSKLNLLAFGSGSTANAIAAPDGTTTADLITPTTSTLGSGVSQTYNNTVSQAHTLSFSVKANGTDFVQLLWHNTLSTDYANFNITTGAVTAGTYTAATITPQGNGWFRCTITSTLAVANNVVSLYIIPTAISSRGAAYTGDGIKGVYVWGGQLERSAVATAYQRVTTASDVTEAGVASCHYVQYDGTDDSMSTAAIDFTSTDAMSVFAGVFKRTDTGLGTVLELSADVNNTNGAFALRAPSGSSAATYSYVSRGSAVVFLTSPTSYATPRYNLVTGLSDISDDQLVIRVNGAQVASSTSDQGTGNYGNHQLFTGRRNNTNFPFAGRDYGLIVVGKAVSAGDLASTETWLADKTPGVTL